MKLTVALFALSGFLSCGLGYEVPEPFFEVFSPKGLRVSVPDSPGVRSVQFLLNVKVGEEGLEFYDDSDKIDGRWTYWNPDAILEENDEISYKVTVENKDLHWVKEGVHTVDKVFPLGGGTKPKIFGVSGPQNLNIFRNRHLGLITEGKKSSYHSSYSSYQTPDSKPITRSSTSSATGTFVMKPNGEVEASGYKKSESYDSTKREGEQWEMSESEMTTEELEELKRFIGPSFRSFSDLTRGQVEEFKRLHGSNFNLPERMQTPILPSGSHSYSESYLTKESSTSTSNLGHPSDYGRNPSGYHHFQHRQTAHESTTGRLRPAHQPSLVPDLRPASSSRYDEHRYNHQSSSSTVSHPVALSHTSSLDEENYQQEVPAALPSTRPSSRNQEYFGGRYASRQQSELSRDPSPTYLTETELERQSSQHRTVGRYQETYGDVQTVEKPKYQAENHYRGSIFRSITTSRANNPQECTVWSETNYDTVTDLREIQKSISKMTCLAALAEYSMREEIRLLKEQNSDLQRKLESLDIDLRRYQSTCKCSG